jgi:hypothetical protein
VFRIFDTTKNDPNIGRTWGESASHVEISYNMIWHMVSNLAPIQDDTGEAQAAEGRDFRH